MKAEQRKELETNTLADKVGQAMQRVKGSSRRGVLVYFVVGIVLLVGIYFTYRWWAVTKSETSLEWLMLDDGSAEHLTELLRKKNSTAGKAAFLQLAWITYWDQGVRMIGNNPRGAMTKINEAGSIYTNLAEACKDDPLFEPQAMLGIAVVEETKAVQDIGSLTKARESYQKLLDKYADAAEGKFAKGRLDLMKDKNKFQELQNVYEDLQKSLNVPGLQGVGRGGIPGLPDFPPDHPPIFKNNDEKGAKEKAAKEKK